MPSPATSGISPGFPGLSPPSGQVARVLLALPPLAGEALLPPPPARLACLIHAASVRSEPESNSQIKISSARRGSPPAAHVNLDRRPSSGTSIIFCLPAPPPGRRMPRSWPRRRGAPEIASQRSSFPRRPRPWPLVAGKDGHFTTTAPALSTPIFIFPRFFFPRGGPPLRAGGPAPAACGGWTLSAPRSGAPRRDAAAARF